MGSREQLDARIRAFTSEMEELIRRATEEGLRAAISDALASGQWVMASNAATPKGKVAGKAPKAPLSEGKAAAPGTSGTPSKRGTAAKHAPPSSRVESEPKPKPTKRKKGQKRSPEELAALEATLESFIQSNAGKRIEEIGKALHIPTSGLAGPVKKLLDSARIRSTGERRATRYYPSRKK